MFCITNTTICLYTFYIIYTVCLLVFTVIDVLHVRKVHTFRCDNNFETVKKMCLYVYNNLKYYILSYKLFKGSMNLYIRVCKQLISDQK